MIRIGVIVRLKRVKRAEHIVKCNVAIPGMMQKLSDLADALGAIDPKLRNLLYWGESESISTITIRRD